MNPTSISNRTLENTSVATSAPTEKERAHTKNASAPQSAPKPVALVVFLENVGHILGMTLPQWVMNVIDYVTEEYAKVLLRVYGAHRRYDRVVILEDARATGQHLHDALLSVSATHRVDLLLLVHGNPRLLVGYRGTEFVTDEIFSALQAIRQQAPDRLDLRMVYGVNCHGATLAPVWLGLGAQVANGALGVNWMPEPSLSIFLRNWLGGQPYSVAVHRSNRLASRFWNRLLRLLPGAAASSAAAHRDHPAVASSRQIIFGRSDLTIDG